MVGHPPGVHTGSTVTAKMGLAHPTALPRSRRRVIAGFVLFVLVAGILSSSADTIFNHSGHNHSAPGPECHSHSLHPHLVCAHAVQKLPLCNACFFHNLVAHSLIPRRAPNTPASPSVRLDQIHRSIVSEIIRPQEETRGPPPNRYL